jgi:hypothetical protein
VKAESSDAAEKYLETLSAEDLVALETEYSIETDTADEEDGEDWDFDAADPAGEDDDDDETELEDDDDE